jgi:hypothetical protein
MPSKTIHTNDWFVSAVIKDGSVMQCLAEVLGELRLKEKFVQKLCAKLGEEKDSGSDALSKLSARIRLLESTIKFRTTILSVERRGAWFRTNSTTATGPFVPALMPDPIFSEYDENNTKKIRLGLLECWKQKNLVAYPLRATESCLWKIVLALNFELEALGDLGEWPRLETYPDSLPPEIESRSLRAFLNNVKLEYLTSKELLNNCNELLVQASEKFWATAPRQRVVQSGDSDYDGQKQADNIRQQFRSRRATAASNRTTIKSILDIQALKLMGFDNFPNTEELKQRYHVLALEMHPDRQGGNEARFKMLAKCYRHLSTRA